MSGASWKSGAWAIFNVWFKGGLIVGERMGPFPLYSTTTTVSQPTLNVSKWMSNLLISEILLKIFEDVSNYSKTNKKCIPRRLTPVFIYFPSDRLYYCPQYSVPYTQIIYPHPVLCNFTVLPTMGGVYFPIPLLLDLERLLWLMEVNEHNVIAAWFGVPLWSTTKRICKCFSCWLGLHIRPENQSEVCSITLIQKGVDWINQIKALQD